MKYEDGDEPQMISMKRSAAERKAASKPSEAMSDAYPYGLGLTLYKDDLDKLGIKQLPSAGDTYMLHAMVKVRSVSQEAGENDYDSRTVCLQITDMCLEPDEQTPAVKKSVLARNA